MEEAIDYVRPNIGEGISHAFGGEKHYPLELFLDELGKGAIKDSILVNFGECGLASSLGSFQVKYVNPITKLCIIRTSREEYRKVWSAITMVRRIGNCPVLFNLLDLSGSIKACKVAALKFDEMEFEHYKLAAGAPLSTDVNQHMQNCLEKINILEH
ncbi:probable ribonuclease P/MRP protein subunit POP5 [Populus nigra]|uniref:probable ribonuclease P/MRP protein subunit POP5 n=1 Tax=Populus nigra TaxID=3691 RepID=UPI002B27A84D|nr:probable ribonuclease P/MRP protein subunit POP5 [Populus nigra]